MARVTCPSCEHVSTEGDTLCSGCGFLLAEYGGDPERVARPRAAPVSAPSAADETCPACGGDIPDPANLVCVDCLEPLARRDSAAPAMHTRRESGVGSLRLLFGGQPVELTRATTVVLGRDPGQSRVASIFAALDNVSRRHASIGVEPDGSAWVRDEYSANGTFVNDTPVPGGRTQALAHGDRLRLASDVVARVELA